MALSRKFLSALGIEAEKIDEIIKAHSETVEALKEERDALKEKADGYDKAQEDLKAAKKQIEDLGKDDTYKIKYEALKEDFEEYKKSIETEKINSSKLKSYKELLKAIGVSEKRIDAIAKLADLDSIKIDKEGNIEGSDDLKKSLSEEWADFIVTEGQKGAEVATPPESVGASAFESMSLAEKMAYANEHPNSEEVKSWLK